MRLFSISRDRWLQMARLAWILLAVLSLSQFVLSLVAYYQDAGEICTAGLVNCHDELRPTSADAASLQSDGITLQQWAGYQIVIKIIIAVYYCAVGLVIFVQKRDDPGTMFMALALWLFGTLGVGGFLAGKYPQFALFINLITILNWVSFFIVFLAFPNGRVVPRWMWSFILIWILYMSSGFLFPDIDKHSPVYQWVSNMVWMGMWLGCAAAQVYRYRRVSTANERRQTKWVVTGVAVWIAIILVLFVTPPFRQVLDNSLPYSARQLPLKLSLNLSMVFFPTSIGIAILRYRLWDIDIIIRRTLQYTLLSGLLALVYFGAVTVLQSIFTAVSGQQSAASLVLSTLVIAALFNPLRKRIQDFIDKRFYRQRYDAEQALASFAEAARRETELQSLTSRLTATVQETLQPERVSLWLRQEKKGAPRG